MGLFPLECNQLARETHCRDVAYFDQRRSETQSSSVLRRPSGPEPPSNYAAEAKLQAKPILPAPLSMKLKIFKEDSTTRPAGRNGPVKAILYADKFQLFLFKYGFTARIVRGKNWRHFTLRPEVRRLELSNALRMNFECSTWLTQDGTTERIRHSKRYVIVKILA